MTDTVMPTAGMRGGHVHQRTLHDLPGVPRKLAKGQRGAALLLALALVCFLLGEFKAVKYVGAGLPLLSVVVIGQVGLRDLAYRRLPVLVLLFVGWMAMSLLWSADPSGTRRALIDVASVVSVALVAGLLLDLDRIRAVATLVYKVLLVGCTLALVVAPGWSTRPPAGDPVAGWHALFGHKNGLGAFLVLTVAALLCEVGRTRYVWLTLAWILLLGSQSASSVGVSLVLTGVVVWRSSARQLLRPRTRVAYRFLSAMVTVLGMGLLAFAPALVTRGLGRSASLTGRTEIWGAVERQISLHPVIGLGWGGVWRQASAPTQQMWREARFQAFYAHNGYLDVLLQLGTVGGLLMLLVLFEVVVRLVHTNRATAALWAALTVLALSLQALSESAPFTGALGLLLITTLAVALQQRAAALSVAEVRANLRRVVATDAQTLADVGGTLSSR